MNLAIRARFEPLRTLGFASIGPAYLGVGTALQHPASQFFILNMTNQTLVFSFDGVTDHFKLPKFSSFSEDITANKASSSGLYFSQGDRLYVKQDSSAPTSGEVSFSVVYISND